MFRPCRSQCRQSSRKRNMTWTRYCTAILDATVFPTDLCLMQQVKRFPKPSRRGEHGSTAGRECRVSFATSSLNSRVSALACVESNRGWKCQTYSAAHYPAPPELGRHRNVKTHTQKSRSAPAACKAYALHDVLGRLEELGSDGPRNLPPHGNALCRPRF